MTGPRASAPSGSRHREAGSSSSTGPPRERPSPDSGTLQSRVARGRVALEALMTEGKLPSRRETPASDRSALQTIMSEVDELSRDRG